MARRCHCWKVIQLMWSWRQTSAGLARSVHTASTACAFSWALKFGLDLRGARVLVLGWGWGLSLFMGGLDLRVVGEFLRGGVERIGDTELELALLGAEHDGLAVHAAHHVEGCLRFAAQRQFEEVVSNALLDGFAQLMLDLEEAVGGAEAADALVGPLVVVVFDPEFDALAGDVEALELGADEEVLPDRRPEALDLAQRHGVLRPGLEVRDAILLEFGAEATGAAPGSVLAAIVREHLLGRLEIAGGDPIDLDDSLGRGTAEQVRADDEAGVIIHEGDEVGVTAAEAEGEDVRLPHLIGRGPLEEAGPREVALLGRQRGRHEMSLVQALPHRLGTGREEEDPAQELGDALDAEGRVLLFERDDLLGDGGGELGLGGTRVRLRLEARLAKLTIAADPDRQAAGTNGHLLADQGLREALLQMKADGFEFDGGRIALAPRMPRATPGWQRGLDYRFIIHVTLASYRSSVTPFSQPFGLTIWSLAQGQHFTW